MLSFAAGVAALLLQAQAVPTAQEAPYTRGGMESDYYREPRLAASAEAEAGQRQQEIARAAEASPPALRGGCATSVGRLGLCLRLSGPLAPRKGTALGYRVEWRGLPPGAGLIVSLQRAAPAGERWRYAGPVGPVQLATIAVSGTGSRDFTWNGREIGCAPGDAPMWCDGVEIGAYRLRAVVVDRADLGILGWPDRRPHRLLVWTESSPFTITGAFDLRSVLGRDQREVTTYLRQRLGFFLPFYDRGLRDQPLPVTAAGTGWCADIALRPPLRGTLRACLAADAVDQFGLRATPEELRFSGDIGYQPGLVAQDRAEVTARRLVGRGQERAADYIGFPGWEEIGRIGDAANQRTWLDTQIIRAAYRTERGGYWLFLMERRVKMLRAGGPAGPQDRLLVKVERNGRACLILSGPVTDRQPDIAADAPPGGMVGAQALSHYDPERWSRPCPGA